MMLDTYYATETPLPADYKALYRICRAMGAKEQEAVRRVADEFFPIGPDGLRNNKRADETIAKARKRIEAAKHNGGKGGRPRKEPDGLQQENPTGLPEEPIGHIGTTTRPQTPAPKDQERAPVGASRARRPGKPKKTPLPADLCVSDRVKAWATSKGFDRLEEHLEVFKAKCRKQGYTYVDWDEAFMEAIRENWAKLPAKINGHSAKDDDSCVEVLDGKRCGRPGAFGRPGGKWYCREHNPH